MSNEVIGIIGLSLTIALMFLRIPLGVVFAVIGGLGTIFLTSTKAALSIFETTPYAWTTNYIFSCLPMFILLGLIIAASDVAKDVYAAAFRWLGRLPGGLAMTTLIVTAIFSAISGAAIAAVTTIAFVCYPEMKRYGYDDGLSTGVIASGASMDIMIPPSVPMIIYVMISDTSVAKLFLAGLGPGLAEVLVFCITIFIMVKLKPSLAPLAEVHFSFVEKLKSLKGILPFLIIFVLLFGGLYGGIFTPTEAGAAGVIAATAVCLAMRRLSWRGLMGCLNQTMRTTGAVFMVLIGVMLFNSFITLSGFGTSLSKWIIESGISATTFLLIVCALYVPLGALMDELSMMMLTVPLYLRTVEALGIDPVWFGILIMMSWQIGMIAPPVGLLVFVTKSTLKQVPINTIYRGCIPFVIGLVIVEALVLFVPDIAMLPVRLLMK
ncbi:MAG: TRAP transporter large permease [Thermodesulfobacteriota bacterium]